VAYPYRSTRALAIPPKPSLAPRYLGPVLSMVATTALWAIAFIVPLELPEASASDISFGRFFAYGACSLFLLGRRGVSKFTARDWALALWFGIFGNILYYFVLVLGIQISGPGLAVPIVGLLPVTVSLFGNMRAGDLPLRALIVPLFAVLIGLLLVNFSRGGTFEGAATASPAGLLCLILPVIMWTWYAVANAAFLKRRSDVQAAEWASVVGAATLGVAMLWFAATVVFGAGSSAFPRLLGSGRWAGFAFWSLVLGLGSSWGAAALFNKASACLPVSLTGQLIVFETVFGVAYVFVAEGRSPKLIEIFGFALAITGIWLSIRVVQRLGRPTTSGVTPPRIAK